MGVAPTERLKLRRQMAAAAGKKESLSSVLVVKDLEVEEELSTTATQAWAEGVWIGKPLADPKKGVEEEDF